jgi:hypothetical protein
MTTYADTNYGSIWHFLTKAFETLIDVDENWCGFCATDMLSTSVPEQVTTQWPRETFYFRTHNNRLLNYWYGEICL